MWSISHLEDIKHTYLALELKPIVVQIRLGWVISKVINFVGAEHIHGCQVSTIA